MQELEHIVRELKARSQIGSDGEAPAPQLERARGSGPVAAAPAAPEKTLVAARRDYARAPASDEAVQAARPATAEPPVIPPMPHREQEAGVRASLSRIAQRIRAERLPAKGTSAEPEVVAAAPKPPAAEASPAPGAGSSRPGRRLFASERGATGSGGAEPPRRRSGGSGGGSGRGERRERRETPFWINGVGAVAAIALIIGIGLWTYRLGQRDAMEVPIVRALEGPTRVQPQDPGGAQIAHQGLAVNEVLDGGGVASVANVVRTAPGDENAQAEDKAAGALVALAEVRAPQRRPLTTLGSNAPTETRAAVAIDDVLAIAHQRLAEAGAVTSAQDQSAVAELGQTQAEADAIDAIVNAIAAQERPLGQLPQIGETDAAQASADAVQAAERQAAEGLTGEIQVAALDTAQRRLPGEGVGAGPAQSQSVDGSVAGIGAAVTRPPSGDADDGTRLIVVTEPQPEPVAEEQVLVAATAPFPPAGEGSIFAPVREAQPRARPKRVAVGIAAAALASEQTAQVTVVAEVAASDAQALRPSIAAVAEVGAPTGALDIIPLPAGTRMIQIGAFDSEAIALQQWDRFASLHSDLLGSKTRFVQRTNNSGRTYYRLRVAGYESKEATRAACSALSARGLPCISVTLR